MSRIKSTKNMTTLHGFTCTMNEHTECSRNNDYVNLSADYRRTERFFSGTKMKTMRWENKHANGITGSGYTEVMQYIAVFITKRNYYKWKK